MTQVHADSFEIPGSEPELQAADKRLAACEASAEAQSNGPEASLGSDFWHFSHTGTGESARPGRRARAGTRRALLASERSARLAEIP